MWMRMRIDVINNKTHDLYFRHTTSRPAECWDLGIQDKFHQLSPTGPSWSRSRHVRVSVGVSVCLRHRVQLFSRPLIDPQIT